MARRRSTVTPLRSGAQPDPRVRFMRLRAGGAVSGRLSPVTGTTPPTKSGSPRAPSVPTGPVSGRAPLVGHGARIITQQGGSARDVAVWRGLSAARRQALKATGGNLRKRVRAIRRRRGVL